MATDNFFRARLEGGGPEASAGVLVWRMPWSEIEASLAPLFERKAHTSKWRVDTDMFGPTQVVVAGDVSLQMNFAGPTNELGNRVSECCQR